LIEERTICAVCAWRENCLKRYRFECSGQLRCPDFTRDLTIKAQEDQDSKAE